MIEEPATTDASGAHGEDGYLTVHGLRHHFIRWGRDGQDPLVLLHGLMNNARYWEPMAERLQDAYTIYAPDLRGHGESEHSPGGYLVWAFDRDLRAVVEALDIEAFDLVAHSFGSRVAMSYARDLSHRLNHLVLCDMGPEIEQSGVSKFRSRTRERGARTFATEAEALAHFAERYPGRPQEFLMRQLAASLVLDETTGNLVFRFDPMLRQTTGRAGLVEVPYLWESLEHITCPTLIVRAADSTILSQEVAEEMVRRLPKGEIAVIEDATHQIPISHPAELAAMVREFLAR